MGFPLFKKLYWNHLNWNRSWIWKITVNACSKCDLIPTWTFWFRGHWSKFGKRLSGELSPLLNGLALLVRYELASDARCGWYVSHGKYVHRQNIGCVASGLNYIACVTDARGRRLALIKPDKVYYHHVSLRPDAGYLGYCITSGTKSRSSSVPSWEGRGNSKENLAFDMNIRLHVCFFCAHYFSLLIAWFNFVWFWWILKHSNPAKNAMKFYIIINYFVLRFSVVVIFTTYWSNVRSVLVKYRTDVFSTARASAASRGPCRKTEVRYFTSTDRTSEVNK